MNSEDFLKQVPLFQSLRTEDMKLLSASVRTQSVKKGGALFYRGSEGTALYIIKKGSVKIVLPSKRGDEVILAIFSEGDFFGEMALLDGMASGKDLRNSGVEPKSCIRNYRKCQFWQYRYFAHPRP